MRHTGQITCVSSSSSTTDEMYCSSNCRFLSYSSIILISVKQGHTTQRQLQSARIQYVWIHSWQEITVRHELLLDFFKYCKFIILFHNIEHLYRTKEKIICYQLHVLNEIRLKHPVNLHCTHRSWLWTITCVRKGAICWYIPNLPQT